MKKTKIALFASFLSVFGLSSCFLQYFISPSVSISIAPPPHTNGETYDINAYGNYYKDVLYWENGEDLKRKLFNTVWDNGLEFKSYTKNWSTNQNSDEDLLDHTCVDVVYNSNKEKKTSTYSSKNTKGWQREHAFPASLMTSDSTGTATGGKGIATDFYNLFASYGSANSTRSNNNYGVPKVDIKFTGDAKYGKDLNGNIVFEPSDNDKGTLARAIFYMATTYGYKDDVRRADDKYKDVTLTLREEYCKVDTTGDDKFSDFCMGNLSTLISWNKIDNVDLHEYQHAERVKEEQNNRNPFIDYPELVDYCFGPYKDMAGQLKYLKPTIHSLNISSTFSHYAIGEETKDVFNVGDTLSFANDISVKAVNKDLSEAKINSFVVNGLNDGYTFIESDIGTKQIQITIDSYILNYEITVQGN